MGPKRCLHIYMYDAVSALKSNKLFAVVTLFLCMYHMFLVTRAGILSLPSRYV